MELSRLSRRRSNLLAALIALACLLLTGCLKQELVSGLGERESQEIIVLLRGQGLEATRMLVARERETPTWSVQVRGGEKNLVLAWRLLQENGLPREPVMGLEEVFAGQGMIPTQTEERAKLLVGFSGEMSRTLRSISGIVDARVHLVLPEDNPLIDEAHRPRPSASVLIKHHGERSPLTQAEVLRLVSKGVEGLEESNIAVVFHRVDQTAVSGADVSWFLGSEELLVAALGLLAALTLISLILLFRLRAKTSQVEQLEAVVYSSSKS